MIDASPVAENTRSLVIVTFALPDSMLALAAPAVVRLALLLLNTMSFSSVAHVALPTVSGVRPLMLVPSVPLNPSEIRMVADAAPPKLPPTTYTG